MIIEDLGRIPMSQQLAATLSRAASYADAQAHPEVTLEHVLLALTEDSDAANVLRSSRVEISRLAGEVSSHIGLLEARRPANGQSQVAISQDLRRILEAAAAAARQGRRSEINGAIVLAAIVGDGKSTAAHLLRAQGLTFEEVIRALQQATAPAPSGAPPDPVTGPPTSPPHAQHRQSGSTEDILANARQRIQSRTAPPETHREAGTVAASMPAPTMDVRPEPVSGRAGEVQRDMTGSQQAPVQGQRVEPVFERSNAEVAAPSLAPRTMPPGDAPYAPQPPLQQAPARRPPLAPQWEPAAASSPAQQPAQHEPAPAARRDAGYMPSMPSHRDGPIERMPSGQGAPTTESMPPTRTGPPPGMRSGPPVGAPAPGYGQPGQPGQMRPASPVSHNPGAPRPMQPGVPPPLPTGGAPPRAAAGPPQSAPPNAPHAGPPARQRQQGPAGSMRVAAGQLVENIPRRMRVAVPVVVEARVARAEVKAIAEGLQGGGAVYRHEVTVTKAMSVRLRAPEGGFFIETSSPETQWIDNVLGVATDDFASWRWTVTPRERGKKRLQVLISARTVGGDGLAAETALPDQVIEVKVGINVARTALRWGGWIAAAVLGGVLARFGESVFAPLTAAAVSLIGG